MEKKTHKTVLVCPLHWGLGHASRMILVIYNLLQQNFEVIIAADKIPLQLLEKEFPQLKTIWLKDIQLTYSKGNNQIFKILAFLPKFAFQIWKEHQDLKKIIELYKIDWVISDNRYGLWNKNVFSVLVTHQLRLKLPEYLAFAEIFTERIVYFFAKKFNEIHIPDNESVEASFSGSLSHLPKQKLRNIRFVGILSKFLIPKYQNQPKSILKNEFLAILSGPEPQRTILQEILIKEFKNSDQKLSLVLGKNIEINENYNNIKIVKLADTQELYTLITTHKYIICRAGYTSIMDLIALGRTALLIPTPGQTEQEYLATYLSDKKLFTTLTQNQFSLQKALDIFSK